MLGSTHVLPETFLGRLSPLVTCQLEVRGISYPSPLVMIIDACKLCEDWITLMVEILLVKLVLVTFIIFVLFCFIFFFFLGFPFVCFCLFFYLFCFAVNLYKQIAANILFTNTWRVKINIPL